MILVTLGTQREPFERLLKYIDDSKIKDEIIVQSGHTKYKSNKMKIFDFVSYSDMQEYIKKADLIITHAGTGSILMPLKENKKIIACPRLAKFKEHVDDHQTQIASLFSEEGYILELNENNNLDDLLKEVKKFKPKEFKSNTENFLKKLKAEIDS